MSETEPGEAFIGNARLIEELYSEYRKSPRKLSAAWQKFFYQIDSGAMPKASITATLGIYPNSLKNWDFDSSIAPSHADLRIQNLIDAYRKYGHLLAEINPIAVEPPQKPQELELGRLGFQSDELSRSFPTEGFLTEKQAPLEKIVDALRSTYSGKVGVEYKGLLPPEGEKWLESRIEPRGFEDRMTIEERKWILERLNCAEVFESFLHTKYVGQKRFSLEGGETLIPILWAIIDKSAEIGMDEVVLGMAHRGRLNVLCNLLNKSFSEIFFEFDESYIPQSFEGSGDVKYHKGYFSEVETPRGDHVKITLSPNPSHLESVGPVVEGLVRAKQFLKEDMQAKTSTVPILIHGDAALSGQGVIYETLQMYKLPGYTAGGTVHLVINNQVGFTTHPKDSRSTRYCTDIAKAFGAPVFHVNAEDPEGCVLAAKLAAEIRQMFHCDVFIDMNCYRKYGHNEGDEPAFTQPLEYRLIRKKRSVREIYRDHLVSRGLIEKEMAESLEKDFKEALQQALGSKTPPREYRRHKRKIAGNNDSDAILEPCPTGISASLIRTLCERYTEVPDDFNIHPKLKNLIKSHAEMVLDKEEKRPIDWGMGEILAYASLLWEGIHVRLSGQDVRRGTFSHRHAVWMDQEKEQAYSPLGNLKKKQGVFEAVDSPLSEMAVLGFEYGYSLACVDALVIWEAQFGDFANGAQVIIDQYIASGEQKWGQMSGLTLFLPHGYEGQGPEHSSARMERFLTLAGSDNMIIAAPTSPAQLFHLLRRQVLGSMHKPLIVFTPKGLLRHPACVSSIKDLSKGHFEEILDDPLRPEEAEKVLLCNGRIYYDLLAAKEEGQIRSASLIRIEQLFPFHKEKCRSILNEYKNAQEYLWVQAEPANMGAWNFIKPLLEELLPSKKTLGYAGRPVSASPATGSHALHKKEHEEIIKRVMRGMNEK